MKLRLFLYLMLALSSPAIGADAATVLGVVVNGDNGNPVGGATVTLRDSGATATTNFNGHFRVEATGDTDDYLTVVADGYELYATNAQTLETAPVEIDNSAAEAAAAAEAARQRREEEQRRQVWQNHRTPRNLYLAVNRGGNQYYFSQSDWSSLSNAQKRECSKVGVVIKKDGQEFILALEDAPGFYTWQDAMNRFGNRLPTKQQGEAWISQQEAVQSAIRAFGGHITGKGVYDNNYPSNDNRHYYMYWTRTPHEEESSIARVVDISEGRMSISVGTYAGRVRVVAPVSVSSAI